MFDRHMRPSTSLFVAFALGLALLCVACEKNQPASSPASCNCAQKHSGRQPPPKEEPADLVR